MSELLDKQVNAQKENLKKYFRGSRELSQAHEKVYESRNKKKMTGRLKYFCCEEGVYKALAESSCNGYHMTSGHRLFIH